MRRLPVSVATMLLPTIGITILACVGLSTHTNDTKWVIPYNKVYNIISEQ